NVGLCFPRRLAATCAARRPKVAPSASTTRQLREISLCFVAYVFICLFILFAQGRYPLRPLCGRSVSCVLSVFHGDEAQAARRCTRTSHRAVVRRDDPLERPSVDLPTSDPEERPDDRAAHPPEERIG